MDKVKIIMFCMLDCIDGSFMSIVSGRRPQKSRPHQEGAWIQGTYFSLTKNSLFKRLKFQAPLTKERLGLVLRLKSFSHGKPTKICISSLSPHLIPLLSSGLEGLEDNKCSITRF